MDVSHEADLALIEPNATTLRADVDFNVLKISLVQISATLRALHEMLASLELSTLLVEKSAHLPNQFSILSCKVLVFVASWMLFGVAMHDPPAFSVRLSIRMVAARDQSPDAPPNLALPSNGAVASQGCATWH